jgi:peroxiredoxin Q/BCP
MRFRFLAALASIVTSSSSLRADPIEIGAAAPAVSTIDENGQSVDLGAACQTGFVLVYFYPKADTPGCTAQACSLRDDFAALTDKGVRVFGVSGDNAASQKAFKEKYNLPFTLLADKEHAVMDAFGVPHTGDFAKRQAFLFKDGRLEWRDLTASTKQQAADVIAAVAALSGPSG